MIEDFSSICRDLEDSLIIGNEELSTIPEKESDEVIKSSVEELVPIPSESEDYVGKVISDFNGYHDSEGDIIYLESLLIDDTIPNLPPEVFLDHDPRSLKDELDKEDLKRYGGLLKTLVRVGFVLRSLDTSSFAALFMEIPSGESKAHIKILSVLWGNRLPIPDGSLPLSSSQSPNDKEGDTSNEDGNVGAVLNIKYVPIATQIEDNVTSEGNSQNGLNGEGSGLFRDEPHTEQNNVLCVKEFENDKYIANMTEYQNISAIQIAVNFVFHEKTKNFEIDLHLVRKKVSFGVIKTAKIRSARNVTDAFTKGLSVPQHTEYCKRLGLLDVFKA
ncbi:hypothetical protein Tco_1164518 [Tanacetum coccineum]